MRRPAPSCARRRSSRCRRRSPRPARSAGCARTCSPAPLNIVLTIVCALLIVVDRAAAGQVPVHRRGLDRRRAATTACRQPDRPRSAPAGPSSSSASTSSSTASIRSTSAGGSTSSSRCWRSASSGWLWLDAPRRDLGAIYFFVVLPIVLVHPAARLAADRPVASVDTSLWGGVLVTVVVSAVGIVVSLPLGILLALGRRSTMPVVRLFSVDLHRVRARRAADHRAVHGERDAAAVRAGHLVAGQAAARADRRRAVRLRLHGRGGARRPAGDPARASTKARMAVGLSYWQMMRLIILPQALQDRHPEHRQHLHRAVQGHDAGLHRRHLRFPDDHRGRARRSELGDAGDQRRPAMPSPRSSISIFCYGMSRYARCVEAPARGGRQALRGAMARTQPPQIQISSRRR